MEDIQDNVKMPEGSSRASDRKNGKKRHKRYDVDDERPRRSKRQRDDNENAGRAAQPDVAFRESLFDALADAEGAEYWARIYGQPIHIYSRQKYNQEAGEYETMSDDEYVRFVQAEMFRKTKAGVREEQENRRREAREAEQRMYEDLRRAEERRAQSQDEAKRAKEEAKLQREIDRSLRRAEERKKKLAKQGRFAEYTKRWESWDGDEAAIPWPTETGLREDVSERSIRSFFVRGMDLKTIGGKAFAGKLKEQRVRWHPDKMQQKMGGRDKVDTGVMEDITMTFQVIDDLWNDTRKAK